MVEGKNDNEHKGVYLLSGVTYQGGQAQMGGNSTSMQDEFPGMLRGGACLQSSGPGTGSAEEGETSGAGEDLG